MLQGIERISWNALIGVGSLLSATDHIFTILTSLRWVARVQTVVSGLNRIT